MRYNIFKGKIFIAGFINESMRYTISSGHGIIVIVSNHESTPGSGVWDGSRDILLAWNHSYGDYWYWTSSTLSNIDQYRAHVFGYIHPNTYLPVLFHQRPAL